MRCLNLTQPEIPTRNQCLLETKRTEIRHLKSEYNCWTRNVDNCEPLDKTEKPVIGLWHWDIFIWSCLILLRHFRAKYTRSLNPEFLGPTLEKSCDLMRLKFVKISKVCYIAKMSNFWTGLPAVQSFWRSQNRDPEPNPSPVELFLIILTCQTQINEM